MVDIPVRNENTFDVRRWAGILFRHFATGLAVLSLLWFIARPHAEEFIKRSLESRIGTIEQGQETLEQQQELMRQGMIGLEKDVEAIRRLNEQQREHAKEVIDILRRIEEDQP